MGKSVRLSDLKLTSEVFSEGGDKWGKYKPLTNFFGEVTIEGKASSLQILEINIIFPNINVPPPPPNLISEYAPDMNVVTDMGIRQCLYRKKYI